MHVLIKDIDKFRGDLFEILSLKSVTDPSICRNSRRSGVFIYESRVLPLCGLNSRFLRCGGAAKQFESLVGEILT